MLVSLPLIVRNHILKAKGKTKGFDNMSSQMSFMLQSKKMFLDLPDIVVFATKLERSILMRKATHSL